ncbi:MAG TPA: UPF0758 domain-containing protein [Pedobacter sp.]|uniref:UPF0758 domain-containing protein n=1 Tax=Pedobacter sp. TaxID=1411316 RepID=UPI002BB3BDF2|nr:UPF0758 domain-containing protein [Pedobacter sp.]HMI05316.1 UPF0758 domain-containing protein [Pedobacter sp.]
MKPQILESESFGTPTRNYFIDFNKSVTGSKFIRITRSDLQQDNTYKRSSIVVFESDFHFLIESFSMLFTNVAQGEKTGKYLDQKKDAADAKTHGIKSWDPALRPREKLMSQGAPALSDAELIALLIGSGSKNETAVALGERILKSVGSDLSSLTGLSVQQLMKFKGIGEAKAISIVAAMEISARKSFSAASVFQMRAVK